VKKAALVGLWPYMPLQSGTLWWGQKFVCDLLLDQCFTPLEISFEACKGL